MLHLDGEDVDDNGRPDFLFYTYTHPQPSSLGGCEESQERRDQHAWIEPEDLEGYKQLLEIVEIVYGYHLPQDWDSRYLSELAQGASIYEIMGQDVDRAMIGADILPSYY